ncbi:MAG TPA: right-handed parallel beta-helix repeat-containing protein [Thermoanaerobaculia bacterium]|nr:right-handed parallel beta-helix repeat-containing protein [Thermoanaerobaculia bacterium]
MRVPPWVRLSLLSLVLLALVLPALPASAQATRTWVSGVGDDVNPCSRTAPCKTFAGAISKTATNGEINVLDPGAFGAVTITKSITISSEGFEAGVLATLGSSGIVVNAPSTAVVVLRGLDIEGAGSGGNGIRFLAGAALHVEDCTINNFTGKGIDFQPNGLAELFVRDSIIRNNQVNAINSGGIFVKPTSTGFASVTLDNVRMENNRFGMRIEGGTQASVFRSSAAGNLVDGFIAVATAVGTAQLNLETSVASNNGSSGVRAEQAGATIRLSNTIIMNNGAAGLSFAGAGAIVSFGNNSVDGNPVNGSPSSTIPLL